MCFYFRANRTYLSFVIIKKSYHISPSTPHHTNTWLYRSCRFIAFISPDIFPFDIKLNWPHYSNCLPAIISCINLNHIRVLLGKIQQHNRVHCKYESLVTRHSIHRNLTLTHYNWFPWIGQYGSKASLNNSDTNNHYQYISWILAFKSHHYLFNK